MDSRTTLLLVEDDEVLRSIMVFDFEREGFRVLQACTGNEAWRIIQAETVHLVITDIKMPEGSGIDLLNRIKERNPQLPPVILVTGYTELNLNDAKEWGAEAVFNKPFDREALLGASRQAVTSRGFKVNL